MIDSSTPGLDRRSNLSRKELLNEYVFPGKPVILTDVVKDWAAIGKWTPAFFKAKYPTITKEISGQYYTLADQMDRILVSTPENPAPYPYNIEPKDHFPELMKDIQPPVVFGKIDRASHALMPGFMTNGTSVHELFFGGHGSSFPFLHYDALFLHTQITQIYGEKEFILYHPDDSPYVYPRADNPKFSQVTNVFQPDLEKFPLFKNTKPFRDVLRTGETIFFPQGWWHTTMMYGPSISYGHAVLNSANYDLFLKDKYAQWRANGRLKAEMAYAFGKVVGGMMRTVEAFK